ncbi:MAG: CARDB domain-containing protein [Planctomycetota bacterium]
MSFRTNNFRVVAVGLALGLATAPVTASELASDSWPSFNITMRASGVSFPAGNAFTDALELVQDRFESEQPSNWWFTLTLNEPGVALGNGENEVWFTSDSSITTTATAFWWSSGSDRVEADVVFNNGVSWTTSNAKTASIAYGGGGSPRWFEPTVIHEMGHVAGLLHEADEYNVMGQEWDHVTCNGSVLRSYLGEDAADGLVQKYGIWSAGGVEDVSVTAFKYLGASGEYSSHQLCEWTDTASVPLSTSGSVDGQPRYVVAPGQSIRVQFTYENNGESTQGANLGFYLSSNNFISTADQLIHSSSTTIARNSVFTLSTTVTIPTTAALGAALNLGVIIDNGNAIGEVVENNNAAYFPILVECATTPYATFFNAPPNPPSLSTSLFTVGDPWSITVDLNTTGHSAAFAFAYDNPVNIALGGGQRLLTFGPAELLQVPAKSGPIANWNGILPNSTTLCGYTLSIQAAHFGAITPFALSNAIDVRIGD